MSIKILIADNIALRVFARAAILLPLDLSFGTFELGLQAIVLMHRDDVILGDLLYSFN